MLRTDVVRVGPLKENEEEIAIKRGVMDADTAARSDRRELFNTSILCPVSNQTENFCEVCWPSVLAWSVVNKINQLNGSVKNRFKAGYRPILEIKSTPTLAILPTLMIAGW